MFIIIVCPFLNISDLDWTLCVLQPDKLRHKPLGVAFFPRN